jgi:hypothetical protein
VLAALVHIVQLPPHEGAQEPAAAVRRKDPDHGDAAGADAAARDCQLEREHAAPAGRLAVEADRVRAVQSQVPRESLRALGVGDPAEVVPDPPERLAELVEVAARPDLDAQAIFSKGA